MDRGRPKHAPEVTRSIFFIFTARRYALHGICYRNSVCLSVSLSHLWTVSTWFDL